MLTKSERFSVRVDLELEARLVLHGLSDGRLAIGTEIVVLDVELCRRQHALRGMQSNRGAQRSRTFVREALTRKASAIALTPDSSETNSVFSSPSLS